MGVVLTGEKLAGQNQTPGPQFTVGRDRPTRGECRRRLSEKNDGGRHRPLDGAVGRGAAV